MRMRVWRSHGGPRFSLSIPCSQRGGQVDADHKTSSFMGADTAENDVERRDSQSKHIFYSSFTQGLIVSSPLAHQRSDPVRHDSGNPHRTTRPPGAERQKAEATLQRGAPRCTTAGPERFDSLEEAF